MPRYDFRTPRLFLEQPIEASRSLELSRAQANYLVNVLRLADGEPVLLFNGRDGEWRANLRCGRRAVALEVLEQTRPQTAAGDLEYLFAPLKHARLDYMVQKAVEIGASRLVPVLTRHTQTRRVNLERMRANAIEAAEQCGILNLPQIGAPVALDEFDAAPGVLRRGRRDRRPGGGARARALGRTDGRVAGEPPRRPGRRLCRGRAQGAP